MRLFMEPAHKCSRIPPSHTPIRNVHTTLRPGVPVDTSVTHRQRTSGEVPLLGFSGSNLTRQTSVSMYGIRFAIDTSGNRIRDACKPMWQAACRCPYSCLVHRKLIIREYLQTTPCFYRSVSVCLCVGNVSVGGIVNITSCLSLGH